MEVTQKDIMALIKQMTRIADALEEQNKLKKREFALEKKRYNRDYDVITESKDSQPNKDGKEEKKVSK